MLFALDTETALIAPGLLAPPLACLSTAGEDGGVCLFDRHHAEEALAALLDSDAVIVGQNIAYDFGVLGEAFPRLLPKIFDAYSADRVEDTNVRQKLCDIATGCYRGYRNINGLTVKLGYSLADLAKRHLDLDLDKTTWRLGYGELRDVPLREWPEGARTYALDD